ncbi:flagellin [Paracoccus endophyticus]|uniref:flagellin n=1 Tax=Paracoccus endophyticus TaxID=2233774 RepID=UPI000DDAD993|nr:flagellin [Paracoccus endophyticus]
MSSILTNNGAMVALQTLKGINAGLAKTQDEISTGKTVATAKDNAAVWAISKVMEADVSGFKAISSGLATGGAAVGMAREGAEKISSLLTKMRDTIISAQSPTSDRAKLQKDVVDLRSQVEGTVKAAQVNGLNLLNGTNTSVNFLSSIDRAADGTTTLSNITVAGQNLSVGVYAPKAALTGSEGASTTGDAAAFSLNAGAAASDLVIDNTAPLAAGDSISVRIGDKVASYTLSANDATATSPADIVAVGLKSAIEKLGIDGLTVNYDQGSAGTLSLTNAGTSDLTVAAQFSNVGSGGLGALAGLDVSTAAGASGALASIETMMKTAIDAAAKFGAAGANIEAQGEFLSKLTDSLKSGIGSLVDANMEETSARLQALQTQQQLGIQSLSIANKAPQNILSLFRG